MHWLQTLDLELFRFINLKLSNPVFDVVMPFASGNRFFGPVAAVIVVLLIWKGRMRALLCVLMLGLAVGVTDGFLCNTLKHAFGRIRPCLAVPDAICLVGKSSSASLPSSHAANWFAATMVAFIYYRRSLQIMLPLALLVSFSRVYNGVHYPSDVLVGAILGAGCAAALVWWLNAIWQWAGSKWFPLWWEKFPSLVCGMSTAEGEGEPVFPGRGQAGGIPHADIDQHWIRLGYIMIALSLIFRLAYIAGNTIQLSEDEAYQWLWSKHLALSYFSKPPMIAYTQFLGTSIWGDTPFGVRFFSPIIAAIIGVAMLRFFAREVNARAGFFLLLIMTATPMMSAGALLMTIDPLSVLFWTLATLAGWRAIQDNGSIRYWLWTGLWMGLGFLSKYTQLFQLLCWAGFFLLWPPARKHLRRPGPYLALLVNLLCTLPVVIWNAQRKWVTVSHLADRADLHREWHPLKFFSEFTLGEFGLLNPIFFVAMIWAAIAFWRRRRHDPKLIYFFSMGVPLFLCYLLFSFRSRVLPNWIAPAVLPLFCMMTIYWDAQWRLSSEKLKGWLTAGLAVGFTLVVLAHNTDLVQKVSGRYLPVKWDPLHRIRVWDEVAKVTGDARQQLLAEGKPVFIIGDTYQLTGIISFYLPEAKACVTEEPLVYCRSSTFPENQFYYWPGYAGRKGQNAIYAVELSRDEIQPQPPPARLAAEFESVTDLGIHNVLYHGQVCRPLQLFACRGLK